MDFGFEDDVVIGVTEGGSGYASSLHQRDAEGVSQDFDQPDAIRSAEGVELSPQQRDQRAALFMSTLELFHERVV
ncbi:MAG: hypothetical protein EOO72_08385 [Myxococcaceae bacterium]|nr:MAG: hypothetical protein EOO72_08385 [Myxococcaceae bacterium]